MNLYQIREAIRIEMAQEVCNEAKITELIIQRDAMQALEAPVARSTGAIWNADMLDAVYN